MNKHLRALCEGAIFLALALILNSLKLYRFPNGGSFDLAMIPVFIFALRWGVGWGMLQGFVFGLLQIFIDGALSWGWQSLLLDYLVAFTPLGLAGLFRGRGNGIFAGVLLGCFARFIVHYISGVTIYRILIPTEVLGLTLASPALYSLVYNGSYMLVNTAACVLILAMLYKPLNKYLQARDIVPKKQAGNA